MATRIQRHRVDIHGTYSLDTMPYSLLELMMETEQAINERKQAAQQGLPEEPYA